MKRAFLVCLLSVAWGLTPTSGQGPVPKPVEAGAEETAGDTRLAGRWFSHFGYLDLTIKDGEVTGTYSCCEGKIRGNQQGPEHIAFQWKDPIYGEGWGNFYLRDGRLVGGWGRDQDFGSAGPWNAVRPADTLEDQAEIFTVVTAHPDMGAFAGTATLTTAAGDDGRVVGLLRGHYALKAQGKPFRQELALRLEGTHLAEAMTLRWIEPIDGDEGEIVLKQAGGGWAGKWNPTAGGELVAIRLKNKAGELP